MDAKKHLNSRRTKRPAKGVEENYWDCSVCTYRNTAEAFKCLMCDVRKGTSTRKPRINPQLVAQQVAQQFSQATTPKQKGSSSRQDRDKKSSSDKSAKKMRPRLKNIDRSSAQQKAVTVNDVTVIITEFQPKRRMSSDMAGHSSSGNTSDSSQSDSASHSEAHNGDLSDRR